jgi:four helix bundle protein
MKTQFDHEKLDVYRVSLELNTTVFNLCKTINGHNRHARDQLIRSAQSIVLNIAEGNGKRSKADRSRFLQISRGSALESAAALDILFASDALMESDVADCKAKLVRIVAMLTRMTE